MGNETPLIVGAGPVGLAAAFLLAKQGVRTRIIDAAAERSPYSRALAVNPRTMDLLEPSGVTAKLQARGMKIQEVQFRRNDTLLAAFSLRSLDHRYPYLLALSQAATEEVLTEALQETGGKVERGVSFVSCQQENNQIKVELDANGTAERVTPPWLFAADGSHSKVRGQLGIGFDGSAFPEAWYLADVPLSTDLKTDAGYVWFYDEGGFTFLIPVVDDINKRPPGDMLWRVIGNTPDLFARLTAAKPSGKPVWESHFHVAHRLAGTLNSGNVYLGGDAAHIHSPIGARGMNLGIEDAWTFAELYQCRRLAEYSALRHGIDRGVVRRVKLLTTMAIGGSSLTRLLRRNMLPIIENMPILRRQMLHMALGLDHALGL